MIGALEDAEDYKAFEAAITADYDAQSAVERELVLRLASLLWRLRRATTMETGLFEIQAEHLSYLTGDRHVAPASRQIVYAFFGHPVVQPDHESAPSSATGEPEMAHPRNASTAGLTANPSLTSRAAFCVSRICLTSYSIVSAGMKLPCGAKWGKLSVHSTPNSPPPCHPRSTHRIDLLVRCGLPRARDRRRSRAAGLQQRSHAPPSRRDRDQSNHGRTRDRRPRSGWLARTYLKIPGRCRSAINEE